MLNLNTEVIKEKLLQAKQEKQKTCNTVEEIEQKDFNLQSLEDDLLSLLTTGLTQKEEEIRIIHVLIQSAIHGCYDDRIIENI